VSNPILRRAHQHPATLEEMARLIGDAESGRDFQSTTQHEFGKIKA
jgi:hypothetical protein